MPALYRDFQDNASLDREYLVSLNIPDYADYVQRFTEASAAPLADPDAVLGLRYGLTRDEYLDVFPARKPGPAPVLLFIHGGYWRSFSARDFAFACLGPRGRGMLTVNANYSLAPGVPLSEIVRQIRAATVWTRQNAARFGGDPGRIAVCGHSAGGHLAAMAALTDWTDYDLESGPIQAVHSISGLFDLRPLPYTAHGSALQLGAHEIAQLSPALLKLPPALPPFLLSYGALETAEFRRQSTDFADRLTGAGHVATALALPGQNHLDAVLGLADPDSALMEAIATA